MDLTRLRRPTCLRQTAGRNGLAPCGLQRRLASRWLSRLRATRPSRRCRKFYDVAEATNSSVATEALRRIGELYAIEARVRGRSSAHRLAERRSFATPIVQALRSWLEGQLPLVPGRSTLAEAIRYAFSRWAGLTRFLHDGRAELDTNPVERAIRPIALGRKNHLFAGSDGGGQTLSICSYRLVVVGLWVINDPHRHRETRSEPSDEGRHTQTPSRSGYPRE
jgi:transposase IS66 family protein